MKSALLATIVALALATITSAQAPVKVYVFTAADPSGLTDNATRDRLKAVSGIRDRLAKNKLVQLVDGEDTATVTVEVTGVWQAKETGATSDTRRGVFGGLQTTTTNTHESFDYAVLTSGTYHTTLEVSSAKLLGSVKPGEQLAKSIEDWLKKNSAVLNK